VRESFRAGHVLRPDCTRRGHARQPAVGNAFYKNFGDGRFTEVSDQVGVENFWPWGVSVDDLNADGFQDIFVAFGMGYPFRYGINSLHLNHVDHPRCALSCPLMSLLDVNRWPLPIKLGLCGKHDH